MPEPAPSVATVKERFLALQARIVGELERVDGTGRFAGEDIATDGGGLSRPRVLEDGDRIEKAAAHFTHSVGEALPPAASERRPELAGRPFEAVAVSCIIHARNPHVPAAHMNLRFFVVDADPPAWHFGGGFDLTPFYPFEEDVIEWHRAARAACERHGHSYPELKANCDAYFFLPHRGEARGVGGLFFDDWARGGFSASLAFVEAVGSQFLAGYVPIFERRAVLPWDDREERFMLIRRGRYAEFNLAVDRGTRYGLQSGRRVESVLASLPPRVRWVYDYRPPPGSREAALAEEFLRPRDWLSDGERRAPSPVDPVDSPVDKAGD